MPESRLDRIERLNEQTAQQTAENAKAIGLLIADIATTNVEMRAGSAVVNAAMKEMLEAQTAMLKTIDRLAKLWERSPN